MTSVSDKDQLRQSIDQLEAISVTLRERISSLAKEDPLQLFDAYAGLQSHLMDAVRFGRTVRSYVLRDTEPVAPVEHLRLNMPEEQALKLIERVKQVFLEEIAKMGDRASLRGAVQELIDEVVWLTGWPRSDVYAPLRIACIELDLHRELDGSLQPFRIRTASSIRAR